MKTANRVAKTICITLPPDLLKKAQKIAAREHRTMSELFREALRHYLAESTRGDPTSLGSRPTSAYAEDQSGSGGSGVVHSFRMTEPTEK